MISCCRGKGGRALRHLRKSWYRDLSHARENLLNILESTPPASNAHTEDSSTLLLHTSKTSHADKAEARMASPRDLVCKQCWDTLFNTQAYQDFFVPPRGRPRKVIQQTTSQHVRDKCSFIMKCQDIASSRSFPKNVAEGGNKIECNWCEYIGHYTCCELDEEGNVPTYEEDLLEITFETRRVDCSTPFGSLGAGVKVINLSLDRRDRKSRQSLCGNGSMHHAFTPANDPAAKVVISRPVRKDIKSEEATEQIRSWIQECESQRCGKFGGFYRDTTLPTRVIDVGLESSQSVRVVDTLGSRGVYATLSYCWGSQKNVVLCQENISQLENGIDVSALPQTIQDAISVTRKMDIPYLWVDALCIVQDEEVEKAREIARMQDIYSFSAVTVIASSAKGAEEGFLSQQETSTINRWCEPVVIPVRLANGKFGSMSLVDLNYGVHYEETGEPISQRAWTTQEQLLAHRKLVFTQHNHTMTWSCPHSPLVRSFGESMHLPYWPGDFDGNGERFLRETLNLSVLAPDPILSGGARLQVSVKDRVLGCWLRLVSTYSLRSVTSQNDKLNALAGIGARCYAPLLGPGYFAGLWEYGLLRQLCWTTTNFHKTLSYSEARISRPLLDSGLSRAPSWSWASVEGGLILYDRFPDEDDEEWLSDIVDVTTIPKFGPINPLGEINPASGRITLRTKLRRAWWHPSSHSMFRKSCASTPMRSSSDAFSYERLSMFYHHLAKRIAPGLKLWRAVKRIVSHTLARGRQKNGKTSTATGEEGSTDQYWSDIPTFDMITDQVTGGLDVGFISPFKRVFRRTGPLPSDSDPEYDSASGAEETNNTSRPERTWWWLVSGALDEKSSDENKYDEAWMDQHEYDIDHVEPFIVYMLPLKATAHPRRLRHVGKARKWLVQGLLLVKDKNQKQNPSKERDKTEVWFKRIGYFSQCPRREFDRVATRTVTII
jgi:hypothetical protein